MTELTDFIVAIELGSSKVTGIAGRKNLDGSVTVLAAVREDSRSFIHRGVVSNIDKTAQCITNIISKLSTQLKTEIKRVYVGMGGQSIRSVKNSIVCTLPASTKVTVDMVNTLMDQNFGTRYPDKEILDVAVQEYRVDQQMQTEPVGIECTSLEGNFLNILSRAAFYRNLNSCFEVAQVNVVEIFLAPMALAEGVLTETERRSGCALVDLGATTTTVSVYYKNILRHLVVIPLGSENINTDLTSLSMDESEAERMKLKYASAYTDSADIDSTARLSIDAERQVESRKFIEVVEGRIMEIVENVQYQIGASGYGDRLLGGLVITGGGANMKNIERAFAEQFRSNVKIRIANTVSFPVDSKIDFIKAQDCTACTCLSLLFKGKENCAGDKISNDIFSAKPNPQPLNPTVGQQRPQNGPVIGTGSVAVDKKKQLEEEARLAEEARQKAIEEEEARKAEEEAKRKAEEERRRNSPWNKIKNSAKKIIDGLTTEE